MSIGRERGTRVRNAILTKRVVAIVLATATLAATAAACGSDETSSDTAAATTSGMPAGGGGPTVVEDGLAPATTQALNLAAAAAFSEASAPGAVMAIRTPEGTWLATIGYEDWDKTAPMSADVHQRIGSVTKTFTVTALLQLAEQGKLSLEDPIEKYVPGMPNGDATLYELASMRSGIPSYTFDESFQQKLFSDPNYVWTPEALTDLVRGAEPMYPPGAMTFYSNTNTVLLGMAIEEVTGEPIEAVMQKQIIEPVGLTNTVFPSDASFPEPHAQGYTTQGTDDYLPVNATGWNPSWGWTAGAMISNMDDLLVWGKVLSTGEGIVSPQTQTERISSFDFSVPVYLGEGKSEPQSASRSYGLGLGLALGWYGHTGELMGFNTVVQHRIEDDITLVVMVNSDIKSGDCPKGAPVTVSGRTTGPCEDPAVHIANALAAALGHPLVAGENAAPEGSASENTAGSTVGSD
jgi:D-alanyl-D-alanine carboxypeptidase